MRMRCSVGRYRSIDVHGPVLLINSFTFNRGFCQERESGVRNISDRHASQPERPVGVGTDDNICQSGKRIDGGRGRQ
jgi:hypothetical protein